jgi:hypothetical protein
MRGHVLNLRYHLALWVALLLATAPGTALAQTAGDPPAASATSATAQLDPDLRVDPVQPDFTLATLPTTLRMPAGRFHFRLTHRFSRPIDQGSVGDFFADFLGFDSPAQIGFELRYGIRPGTQVAVHRTNNRDIQFIGQHEVLRQDDASPVAVHAIAAVQGSDNFSEDFSTTLGAVVSHRLGGHGVVYAHPLVVFNSSPLPGDATADDHTVMVGLGTRLRLGASQVYVVAEYVPRVGGYDGGVDHASVAIERRYGGHVFQFNVSNNLGTTMRQIARGGPSTEDWVVGFNLSRRFF